ncbi:hydroxyquinol 1,2-dioxygenase [Quadrisphaera granulorum]|uniref:Hydroxyquinol 1,2-dioxygenase n=1 Tax=Quadrisphaera granulorum TaxID=317664 RepID=A0A316A5Z1_9ACTN|nr:dioxygenase [Quadrisphaera granulorum]PWJ52902.1 hydroxyquinol 1,2-dioxygenase [Quadrisphaera granulorum]SZE97284.1 hydroxyquinol 1,2-dioxygenase [Quadrisphaera granulorum]
MTGYFTPDRSVEVVTGRTSATADPRTAEVVASLVEHLHAFVKDVELTQGEWQRAVDFLTATGRTCTDERQEFVLLSDVLGISMLVDAVAHPRPRGATESTVLGPFHVEGAPQRAMGDDICLDGLGESCLFEGRVLDLDGAPVAGACLDVWSDNAEGYYDVQQPDVQPRWNNRGRFITGADGRYCFRGIKPTAYPIPDDGPVGQLLAALGRSPYRPAHLHLIVTAPGFRPLVTHTFVDGDEYLGSDAVFGVKESLIATYTLTPQGPTTWRSTFDVVLAPDHPTDQPHQ